MIADVARTKEVNHILVYSLDRFSRAGIEGIITKQYLKSKGLKAQMKEVEEGLEKSAENLSNLTNYIDNAIVIACE